MSITRTRGEARGRNLSSGAVLFPKEEKEAPPATLGVVAIWLLAIAFGVAFWVVLFYVACAMVGRFY